MKSGREHRIPLNEHSLEILKTLNTTKRSAFVFIGEGQKKPLPQMAMLKLLRRMKQGDLTVHGFRSSFKDWTRERTNFANEVSEAALAHISGDKVERAYARGDLFEKRVKLMEAWATYCNSPIASADVVPINRQAAQ